MVFAGSPQRRTLIIVENLPSPFDRRVWQEATTLRNNGYQVSIICPTGKGYDKRKEVIDDIHIYRYRLPLEADNAIGYLFEYAAALTLQLLLAIRVAVTRGFDVIHACNPPDNIFLISLPFRLFGKQFLFDHHDITPELFEAKFDRKGPLHRVMLAWERWSFKCAKVSIATNNSYRDIAIKRGKMPPNNVFVVRSGPDLSRLKPVKADPSHRNGRKHLVGYVGVMGFQEGIDLLLESIEHIVKRYERSDIQFVLIGSGTELPNLVEASKKRGLEDFVTFTGRVSDADLVSILSTADVCVNPDRPNEMNDKSTMNKIMEYMALGKPIVQYDLTEGRFSAQDASLYADKDDPVDFAVKILQLVDDPQRSQSMGTFGRNRVINELAWEHEEPKLLAAYDALWS
ncbi:MAG: glycosyltransferase family 4 protein [Pseudomonadota bacterium]